MSFLFRWIRAAAALRGAHLAYARLMHFTHKATVIGGETAEDPELDRQARLNGRAVGRVSYYTSGPKGFHHWKWATTCYPPNRGRTATRPEALLAIKRDVISKITDGVLPMSGKNADIVL